MQRDHSKHFWSPEHAQINGIYFHSYPLYCPFISAFIHTVRLLPTVQNESHQ